MFPIANGNLETMLQVIHRFGGTREEWLRHAPGEPPGPGRMAHNIMNCMISRPVPSGRVCTGLRGGARTVVALSQKSTNGCLIHAWTAKMSSIGIDTIMRIPNLVLLAGLLVAACGESSSSERSRNHIDSALAFRAEGDYRAAVIELKSAIQAGPKDPQPRRLLGESYLAIDAVAQAEKELDRAWELGDRSPGIRLLRAKVKYRLGDNDAVIALTENLASKELELAESQDLLVQRGLAFIGSGGTEKGRRLIEEVASGSPNVTGLVALAPPGLIRWRSSARDSAYQ